MEPHTRFVVTPWRSRRELVQLRQDLYRRNDDKVDRRQVAVNKVLAWRTRQESLPLLLDSTADIVDVVLQDEEGGLKHNALRLLYATAISRFITGLLDTQIDMTRDRPSWFPPGKSLQLPVSLLETRHCIVHRHMPTLGELKRAVDQALAWLWEWYWSHLEAAFSLPTSHGADGLDTGAETAVQDTLHALLKTYLKARKSEIKQKRTPHLCTVARNAVSTYTLRFSPSATTLPSTATSNALLRLLGHGKMMLPADTKRGSSMSGAFLIWSPLLLEFCAKSPTFFASLLEMVLDAMNGADADASEAEREGMCRWAAHMLTSTEWQSARGSKGRATREKVLGDCFSEPGAWNLRLAEMVVGGMGEEGELWRMVLEAARSDTGDSMVVDEEVAEVGDVDEKIEADEGEVEEVVESRPVDVVSKITRLQKVVGPWKPKPIGWLPEGWDEDA